MHNKNFTAIFLSLALIGCQNNNNQYSFEVLTDGQTRTSLMFDSETDIEVVHNAKLRSYKVWSSGNSSEYDPVKWNLYGHDGESWQKIESRDSVKFCARFQEKTFVLPSEQDYKSYKIRFDSNHDSVSISEIAFFEKNISQGWENFPFPKVELIVEDSISLGSRIYNELVQDVPEYVAYHAQRVCQILHYSQDDPLLNVDTLLYTLRHYDGISAKSGAAPTVSVVYSTKYCEKIGSQSLYNLNDETRGVLFHELTHAYQYEPKGCGTYADGGVFWAHIEGVADAVRIEAGLFDVELMRKPAGHWLDGYKTTGFFLHWLKTKDPNAIRKFHASARDLEQWSFDGAMQYIFQQPITTQELWDEYQRFLEEQQNNTKSKLN